MFFYSKYKKNCGRQDSNMQPFDSKSNALSIALRPLSTKSNFLNYFYDKYDMAPYFGDSDLFLGTVTIFRYS